MSTAWVCAYTGCCKHPAPSVSSDAACCRCDIEEPCEQAVEEQGEFLDSVCLCSDALCPDSGAAADIRYRLRMNVEV